MATVKVADVVEALKRNGFPWAKHRMIDEGGASCAIGQAYRNLFGHKSNNGAWNLCYALDTLSDKFNVGHAIMSKNDNANTLTYEEVVKYTERILAPYLERTIEIED